MTDSPSPVPGSPEHDPPKFTRGPWRAVKFSSVVGCPITAQPDKTKNTFNVAACYGPIPREEVEANARLIASAPELYAALKVARQYMHLCFGSAYEGPNPYEIIDSALAKVESK